jgi:protein disulfide-isomerase
VTPSILRRNGVLACAAVFVFSALSASAQTQNPPQINWQTNVEAAQRLAAQTNRLVLLHFWAPWCKPCLRLDSEVFSQPQFGPALEANYVPVKINADEAQTIARAYGVTSLPVDVIITPTGKLVTILASPANLEKYITQLNDAAASHRQINGGAYAQVQPGSPTSNPAAYQAPVNPPPAAQAAAGDRYADYNNRAALGATAAGYPAQPGAPQTYPAQQAAAAGYPAQPPVGTNYAAQLPLGGAYNQQPPAGPTGQPQGNLSFGPGAAAPAYGQQSPAAGPGVANAQPGAPPNLPPAAAPPVQLPPGSPPLGLEGYCPVTLVTQKRWVAGDKRWGAVHRDRTYLFAGPEEQKRFLASPDAFSPVISGNDPVLALDQRQAVPGTRKWGVFLGGRIYLFSSEASMLQFEKNPNRYAAEVVQAMR